MATQHDEDRLVARDRERSGSQWDDRSARWDDREERNRAAEVPGASPAAYSSETGFLGQGGQEMGYRSEPSDPREPRAALPTGGHRGKGPRGYARSDERVRQNVCDVLTDDDDIDATNIEVRVRAGEVTLDGTVDDREQMRLAEDRIANLPGVRDVINQLRLATDPSHRA